VSSRAQALADLRSFARYAWDLRGFLRQPLAPAECRGLVEERLRTREESFLNVLEAGVFAQPASPYRALLQAAGVELGDVVHLVRSHGLDATLERLHDAGVYVTFDEFKGRRPIERLGLSLPARQEQFDNPLVGPAVAVPEVGSRGSRRTSALDLVHVANEAAYQSLLLESFDAFHRPYGLWHPVPPGRAGLIDVLRVSKLGKRIDRWFSQTRPGPSRGTTKWFLLTRTTAAAMRLWGTRLPDREYVPLSDGAPVARWLAEHASNGMPALLVGGASAAVRVCLAAEEAGLDISGTFFRLDGEPYTSAKADVVGRTGGRAIPHYSAVETGWIGVACADPRRLDDVHLLTDKLGIVQREREVASGTRVGALLLTTLRPSAPKLLLNVESDDYGLLEDRPCECLFGRLGFTRHLHGIRSYDKLTSAGMTFVGDDAIALLDEILPARFGGAPTDYQLVEEEEDGMPRVTVVVSPRVGEVREAEVIAAALEALAAGSDQKRMMSAVWRTGETLKVVRREPHATASAKILPLHVLND
jgi:hypothetical protein